MSNIVEFKRSISAEERVNGVALLDGTINFATPLQLPTSGLAKMQVCSLQMSDLIPNVFDARPHYAFNNTLVRVWTNITIGQPVDIQLPPGIYSDPTEIAAAINSAVVANTLNWYANAADPPLIITANTVTGTISVVIDTSKLLPPHIQFTLDLRKATQNSDMNATLGFSEAHSLLAGLIGVTSFTSDLIPRMDAQGTMCDVWSSLIVQRRRNDTFVRTMAIVPFAGKTTRSDSLWPSAGQVSPIMVYEGSRTILHMTVEVRNSQGQPMLFLYGDIHAVVAFHF